MDGKNSTRDQDKEDKKIRNKKNGGGIMIAIRNDIEGVPVVASNHDEDVEILVVEVSLRSMKVRFLKKKNRRKNQ